MFYSQFLSFFYLLFLLFLFFKIKKLEEKIKNISSEKNTIISKSEEVSKNNKDPWQAVDIQKRSGQNDARQSIKENADKSDIMEKLKQNWLLWVGGVSLFLGGVYIVQYSIKYGLLSPALRCVIGFLIGSSLISLSEYVLLKEKQETLKTNINSILSGAGISFIYSSIYASSSLYHIIGAKLGFMFLATVSVLGVVLSLRHGKLTAFLGILGAYFTPVLINTGSNNVLGLVVYLSIIFLSVSFVFYKTRWQKLMSLSSYCAILWGFVICLDNTKMINEFALSLFMYLLLCFVLYFIYYKFKRGSFLTKAYKKLCKNTHFLTFLSFLVICICNNFSQVSLFAFIISSIILIVMFRYEEDFVSSVLFCGIFSCLLLYFWSPLYSGGSWRTPLNITGERLHGSIIPPEFEFFANICMIFISIFIISGFSFIRSSKSSNMWALSSSVFPFIIILIAYFVIGTNKTNLIWSFVSLFISFAYLYKISDIIKYCDMKKFESVIAIFAITIFSYIALSITLSLEKAWLTVSLSMIIPAMSYVYDKLRLEGIKKAALSLGVVILVRLFFNSSIFEYKELSSNVSWVLYGYGVPALSFYVGSKLLQRSRKDFISDFLMLCSLLFVVVMTLLQTHSWLNNGDISYYGYTMIETGINLSILLSVSLFLYLKDNLLKNKLTRYFGIFLRYFCFCFFCVFSLGIRNPYLSTINVGDSYIIDSLLISYFVPSLLFLLYSLSAKARKDKLLSLVFYVVFVLLSLCYLLLEVRHYFHGEYISFYKNTGYLESLLYSFALLLYSSGFIVFGWFKNSKIVKNTGFVILIVTILKVFVVDMKDLVGLYRAMSFICLGFSLVLIGYLNQKLKKVD